MWAIRCPAVPNNFKMSIKLLKSKNNLLLMDIIYLYECIIINKIQLFLTKYIHDVIENYIFERYAC